MMKNPPKLTAVSTAIICAVILSSAFIYVEVKKEKLDPQLKTENESTLISSEIKRLMTVSLGKSLEEDKQAFEYIIHQLLFVSVDDMNRGFGAPSKIDMALRKKYFLDNAWEQYQKFVRQQKEDMATLGTDSGAPYKCGAKFNYGSQKYIGDKAGNTKFLTEGYFSCGAWDAYGAYGKFIMSIITADDVTKPDNLKIAHWSVEILEPVKPKKYPCIVPDTANTDPHYKGHLEYQKKNGCI